MYVSTDGHFRPPLMLFGRLGGADLNITKFGSVGGLANRHLFPNLNCAGSPAMPCGDTHQSFTDAFVFVSFLNVFKTLLLLSLLLLQRFFKSVDTYTLSCGIFPLRRKD